MCRTPCGWFLYANASPGSEKLQVLQDAWTECAGDWKRSSLYLKMTNRTTSTSHGARTWLTRQQLTKKYDSADIAAEICDAKDKDPELRKSHTKPHPDAPGVEAGNLLSWRVWDVVQQFARWINVFQC